MARVKGIFKKRCPYCNSGDQLYTKLGDFGSLVYGCKRCEGISKTLKEKGLSKREILKILEGR